MEDVVLLKDRNQELLNENLRLKKQILPLQQELEQIRKELAKTTDLVVDMRIELNNWKNDNIGYRNEMRSAAKAQLQALYKILVILGGETKTEPENVEIKIEEP